MFLGRINIDGPYGCPSLDIEDYPVIALVCGGVGVTPCMSMLEYLFRNQTTLKQKKLRKVFFRFALVMLLIFDRSYLWACTAGWWKTPLALSGSNISSPPSKRTRRGNKLPFRRRIYFDSDLFGSCYTTYFVQFSFFVNSHGLFWLLVCIYKIFV